MEFIDGYPRDIDLIVNHANFNLYTRRGTKPTLKEEIPVSYLKPVFIRDFTVNNSILSSYQIGKRRQWLTMNASEIPSPAPAGLKVIKQPMYDTMEPPIPAPPGECIDEFLRWVADKRLKGEPITSTDIKKYLHVTNMAGGYCFENPPSVRNEEVFGAIRVAKGLGPLKDMVYARMIIEGELEYPAPF